MHKLQMASRFPTNIKQNKKVYFSELDLPVYIKSLVMVATWLSENSA